GDILLNDWAGHDLDAHVGDRVEMDYYVTGEFGRIETRTASFTLRGIVPMNDLVADPGFVPQVKGVTDTRHMADCDPPCPVDLKRIRDRDEAYWDRYRTAPKAFVCLTDGQKLWTAAEERFGRLTSIRLEPLAGQSAAQLASTFEPQFLAALKPEEFGV